MAGESSLTRTYYDLATATIENYVNSQRLFDAIFEGSKVLMDLRDRVRVVTGGERLSGGINDKSQTAASYSGTEGLNVNIANISTRWFLSPKLYYRSVGIDGDTMTSNRGVEAFFNILEARMSEAENAIADKIATDICEDDGTGNSSKNIDGFPAMMATTTTSGTYASINSATNTKWRNQIDATVGSTATSFLPAMRTLYNNIMKGGMGQGGRPPNRAYTTQTVHEALEALLYPMFRFNGGGSSAPDANLGVGDVYYKNMPISWDPHITTTGVFYCYDDQAVELLVYRGRNFEMDDEGLQKPVNQDARIGQVFFKGNLVCYNRTKTGKMTGLT